MITSTTIFLLNCNSVLASSPHHCLLHPISLTFPRYISLPSSLPSLFLPLSLSLSPSPSFSLFHHLLPSLSIVAASPSTTKENVTARVFGLKINFAAREATLLSFPSSNPSARHGLTMYKIQNVSETSSLVPSDNSLS